MKKEKIVIIGANAFQNKLIEKAKEKGYETHVFAWKCGDIGEYTADFFYPISIVEKEKILLYCKQIEPNGICSIGSDLAVPTVNYIADKLGLVGNDKICSILSTNKYEMRTALWKNGLPSPRFCKWNSIEDMYKVKEMDFPLIIKPVDRSGSRGISKVLDMSQIKEAIEYAKSASFSKEIIIEEYVDGTEYSIEYVSINGKHYFLAATRKYTTGAPNFVEIAHYQPACIDGQTLSNIQNVLEKAFDILHIKNGASHSEVMLRSNGEIKIIEIGSRMGGDCIGSDLVPISTGFDYVGAVIDISCGNIPALIETKTLKIAFIKFILSKEDIDSMNQVKKEFKLNVKEVCLENMYNNSNRCRNSAERMGHYILSLDSEEDLEKICDITNLY